MSSVSASGFRPRTLPRLTQADDRAPPPAALVCRPAKAPPLKELKAKSRLVLHGAHRPILVIYDRGRVFAVDNRCPHMGFPLERGSVEDYAKSAAGLS